MIMNRRLRIGRIILTGLAALTVPSVLSHAQELPRVTFHHESRLTTSEGHTGLEWSGDRDSLMYELQSAREPDFIDPTSQYHGTDEASFLSGLTDGRYFFRVRARPSENDTWGPWSESVELVCEHHSLTFAWTLFTSGGLLFLFIVFFVGLNARLLHRFERNDA